MFTLAKGWTKGKVLAQVKKYNNGTKATGSDGNCRYKLPNGNRCAIGCFIPDAHPALNTNDNLNVDHLLKIYPDLYEYMPFNNMEDLRAFQRAHDVCKYIKIHESIGEFLESCEESK